MANRLDDQVEPQTTDLPGAAPSPGVSVPTDRRQETSRCAESADDRTAPYVPAVGDASSATGGYTPSDMPSIHGDKPAIPGYQLLDELGHGGMGVVYRARQIALDRVVAIKMILAGAHARPKDLDRFRAEAQAVAKFQHPNIVQIHEVGEVGGLPYFSLEFVAGGSLSQKISRDPQAPRYSAEIVEALARAMQYAHDRGIIHRDLKPANVLLAEDGTPKITDFGLAKRFEEDSGRTQTGQILGTPSYMAPEQAYGDTVNAGPPADVYALGATLYDLLTGRPPFSGSTMLDTLEMVRTREPVPPGNLAGNIPRDLETIALKCLQKDKAKRYDSAGALADDLRRFLDGRPIVARPVSAAEKTWRWAKRNPWVAGLGTSVAALLITVAAVASIMTYQLSIEKKGAEKAREDEKAERIKAQEAQAKEEIAKNKAIDEQKKAEAARTKEEIAKKDAIKSQQVTSTQRRLALDTVRGVLIDVDKYLKYDTRLVPIRRLIIDKMLVDLDRIRDHALKNELENRTEAVAFSRIGGIYYDSNRIADARPWLEKAHELLKNISDDQPTNSAALFNLAGIKNQLGDLEWRAGSGQKARALYAEALRIRQNRIPIVTAEFAWAGFLGIRFVEPRDIEPNRELRRAVLARDDIAVSHALIAFSDFRLGSPNDAVTGYLQADREYSALPKWRQQSLIVRRARAEIQVRLGDTRFRLDLLPQAAAHFQAALKERLELLRITPDEPYHTELINDVALTKIGIGDFRLMAYDDAIGAAAAYAEAFDFLAAALKAMPDRLLFQRAMSAALYRLGAVAGKRTPLAAVSGCAVEIAPAAANFCRCLAMRAELAKIDKADITSQVELMLARARVGQAVEVEKSANELLPKVDKERGVLFYIACALSLASAGDNATATRCRDQAFTVLDTLIKQGWNDRVTLEKDPDLEPIRKDPRFAKVVAPPTSGKP